MRENREDIKSPMESMGRIHNGRVFWIVYGCKCNSGIIISDLKKMSNDPINLSLSFQQNSLNAINAVTQTSGHDF